MNTEKLAKLRAKGFLLDPKFDRLAAIGDRKEKNPEIKSVYIIEKSPFKYGDSITLIIETNELIGERIEVTLFDNDKILGFGEDSLLWKAEYIVSSNKISIKVNLTNEMREKAHKSGETEFFSAEYYFKVHSKKSNDAFSSQFSVKNKFKVNYFTQQIIKPNDDDEFIQDNAVPILNDKKQTIAFITPDEKLFIWIDDWVDGYNWQGFFEDGIKKHNKSYIFYYKDKIEREENPISWGIYLVTADTGEFVLNLLSEPKDTITGFGKALKKIVTLDFSIAETWDRIQRSDVTDATYVVSTILMTYAGSKLSKIPKKDIHKLAEIVEDITHKGSKKLTWPEVLELFKKALIFEGKITQELLKKYPPANGYIHISRMYLSVNNVVSIADNCIFNINTKKWILNETKYGIRNSLRRNQQVIENAIKADVFLEIRTATAKLDDFIEIVPKIEQGSFIKISEILRSHSIDGNIIKETIKSTWKK